MRRFWISVMTTVLCWAVELPAQSEARIRYFEPLLPDSIRVHVSVLCRGTYQYAVPSADFTFRENGTKIPVVRLLRPATPGSGCFDAALVINRSATMSLGTPRLIDQVKESSKGFIDGLRAGCDRAAVISFGTEVAVDAFLTDDKKKLKQRIDSISTEGNIALWDAMYLSLLELRLNGASATRAAVIVTNGIDNSSASAQSQDVLEIARQNDILLYIVSIGSPDTMALRTTAVSSGGRFYYSPAGVELPAIMAGITEDLREQHVLYQFEYRSPLEKVRRRIFEVSVTGCDVPLTDSIRYDIGFGGNPPAPFSLSTSTARNTDVFRLDRTGCRIPEDFAADTLRLRWQASAWPSPYLNDPVNYSVSALVDSAGALVNVTVPSDNNGTGTTLTMDGQILYRMLIARGGTLPPDSLVSRVYWYVTARNSAGQESYSDTAGMSRVFSGYPTPPLLLSLNRRPGPPRITEPARDDQSVSVPDTPVLIAWDSATDANRDKGTLIGGFKRYNPALQQWETNQFKTVDTLSYQVRVEVLQTYPDDKGAPPGTILKIQPGLLTSTALPYNVIDQIFGGLNSPLKRADSVRVSIVVDVRDFILTNAREFVEFDSLWSGVGCRPHLNTSEHRTLLLIRKSDPTLVDHPLSIVPVLEQNYPNPFTGITTIRMTLPPGGHSPSSQSAELTLHDPLGRMVLDLTPRINGGESSVTIRAAELPRPGVYLYRLRSGSHLLTRKLLLLR